MLKSRSHVTFIGNRAQPYGGALLIEEPAYNYFLIHHVYRIKCFFEQLEPYYEIPNLIFSNNTAGSASSSLYGGWVDFCATS